MSALALRSSYRRSALRIASLGFLFLLFTFSALAESHVRIVRLSYVDGDVEIDKGDGHGFVTAFMNMPVLHQSKLWARDGIAEVEFENGTSIRLTPDTIVAFSDLSSDSDGRLLTKVELTQGTAYFDVRHRDPDTFALQLGRKLVEFPKSAHFRVDSENREFEIAVLGGEVQVANGNDGEVAVNKSETIRLDSDDPDRYQLAKGIDSENYDSWDHDRSQGHDQVVSTATVWNGTGNTSSLSSVSSYPYIPGYGFGWGSGGTLLIGSGCGYSGFGSPLGFGSPWGFSPYDVQPWCPSYYPNWNSGYLLYPVRNAPLYYRPHPGPHPRPRPAVTTTENRVTTLPPARRVVIDNDVLAQRYPHSSAVSAATAGNARVNTVPANGLVSNGRTPAAPVVAPVVAPVTVVHTPAPVVAPMRPVIRTAPMPSVASHASAPGMRSAGSMGGVSGGGRMSSPSMSGGRMSSSSMSSMSGGMHSSGASMGGGGGAHSGGGGHR
jgi:hypothetical protein